MSDKKIITNQEEVFNLFPRAEGIKYPPYCFLEMGAEMLEYVVGESLLVKFPVKQAYENPIGYMQGGFVVAAMDNTIGPLSYLVAPPSVTTNLNTTYMRPIHPKMTHFYVLGKVVEVSRSLVHLEAETYFEDKEGKRKTVARLTASAMILPQYQK